MNFKSLGEKRSPFRKWRWVVTVGAGERKGRIPALLLLPKQIPD